MVWEKIRERINDLRERDQTLQIFGSTKHGYINTPVEPADIERFEDELGLALPAEYRDFLLYVGHGAGPYYGIWSPRESFADITWRLSGYLSEEQKEVHTNWPFPLTRADVDNMLAERAAGNFRPFKHDWPCNGCVSICDHGCTFWSVLVLNGEFAGRVFDLANFVGYFGEWTSATRPPGLVGAGLQLATLEGLSTPPTFGEWYEGWLDRCFSDQVRLMKQ